MKCASCGKENPPEFKFCDACGEGLYAAEIVCPTCSHLNPDDMKFCEECGIRLGILTCPSCLHENPAEFQFCEECGNSLELQSPVTTPMPEPKMIKTRSRASSKSARVIAASAPVKSETARSPIFVRPARRRGSSIWLFLARTAFRSLVGSVLGFLAGKAGVWVASMLFAAI